MVNERQGRTGGVVAGGILVVLGILFLVRDQISIDWGLIWPFALIIPGAWLLGKAFFSRDQGDRRGAFIGGGILLFLGIVFLFQNYLSLDWSKIWPFFLIIPGAGLLLGAFLGWGRNDAAPAAGPTRAQQPSASSGQPPGPPGSPPSIPPTQPPAAG